MIKYIVSLSGGLDSAVLCASLQAEHGAGAVGTVFFQYGSKHGPWEEKAARTLAGHFGAPLRVVDLRAVFAHAKSALLEGDMRDIPKEAYGSASMDQTIVPGRNLMFAAVLASIAESHGAACVALATHAGDHCLYPDCRPTFNLALEQVIAESTGNAVHVATPFSSLHKKEIVALGAALGVPFALTRSCYEQTETSCGQCGTCRERLDAFAANGLVDPVGYSD